MTRWRGFELQQLGAAERRGEQFDAVPAGLLDAGPDRLDGVVRGGVALAGHEQDGDARGQRVHQGGEGDALVFDSLGTLGSGEIRTRPAMSVTRPSCETPPPGR